MDKRAFTIRVPRRAMTIGLTILLTAVLVAPTTVWAAHQFTDVPDDNVFHDDIAWLSDAGVTIGCNPPDNTLFCPGDSVTREQMAAFMRRLAENQVVDAASVEGVTAETLGGIAANSSFDALGETTADLTATGLPLLDASLDAPSDGGLAMVATAAVGDALGPYFVLWLEIDDGSCEITGLVPDNAVPGSTTFVEAIGASSMATSGMVLVEAGTHTATLCAAQTSGAGEAFGGSLTVDFVAQATVDPTFLSVDGAGGPAD